VASANALISKIKATLSKVNATDRVVYKRVVTKSGGDPLLGRGVSVSTVDTLLDPQPAVIWPETMPTLMVSGASLVPAGACYMVVSASAMTRFEVADSTLTIVFKDTISNKEEQYNISGFTPQVFQGTDVAFECALVSKKR